MDHPLGQRIYRKIETYYTTIQKLARYRLNSRPSATSGIQVLDRRAVKAVEVSITS